ncbi:nicotinamide-nucleotide amidohydrolase PncC [mine drainage metagenome]|uniref:Nicotinamide-nucleotide amidohydrolase PncC n=1 Tax=mine drainage metagenome TaxID=410659 RepID=A0A1J5RUL2_9ZZZZ
MSLLPAALDAAARAVLAAAADAGLRLATAESCTGGLVAAALTGIPGSSQCMERGFVTYSNEAKTELLGVPAALIAAHGAVSEAVARAMAAGALAHARAEAAVSITGIAGPGGGSPEKPVGTVHFAACRLGGPTLHRQRLFSGDRDAVRLQAALEALDLLGTVLCS